MKKAKLSIPLGLAFVLSLLYLYWVYKSKSSKIQTNDFPRKSAAYLYEYGDKPADFRGNGLLGEKIVFKNELGKVKLLVFLNSVSRNLTPYLSYYNVIKNDFDTQNLQIILISPLPKEYLIELKNNMGINFDIIVDSSRAIERRFINDRYVIHTVLVDKSGVIRFTGSLLDSEALRILVERYLEQSESIPKAKTKICLGEKFSEISILETERLIRRRISDLENKPIVLTFITSPCPTCKEEKRLLTIKEIGQKYGEEIHNIVVYHPASPISLINESKRKYDDSFDTYLLIDDARVSLSDRLFDPRINPLTFLLDKEGKIVFMEGKSNASGKFKSTLERFLAKTLERMTE